ncbi:hypothetical protein COU87_04285 [Candidatus Roizmanbacteria bacterium CG10_big_fil_rev_8_21_14_0_10_39_12]|uniref:Glutaredoxin domain-containing protein n=1 Tax=Candidatus Roizmanbacteria bacterium CG10_big_fil_rev_8_21_14_0_10_39_12 TaxID=1974852 RepID=A0A2M8KNJ6_9BACT|nr:MAG: hypothetical protein COU87_04285 [Candidatus Roizmanbacteria bacterium CG10_big_fil_rev_8_21_14_0_10_39_12]
MKVTIYTINDCKFSQVEKEYLKKNNIPFEEKNLETNREYLTEMLSVSDNFAGTPVTKVEKDGGETLILKGFTEEEFAKALNITVVGVAVPQAPQSEAMESTTTPTPQETHVPSSADPEKTTEPTEKPAETMDMTIESLSGPAVSTESTTSPTPPQPAPMNEPSQSPITPTISTAPISSPNPPVSQTQQESASPINPLEDQEVGPISLETLSPTPSEKESTAPQADTSSMGAAPAPQPPVVVTPPQEEKPKSNEALDSVLQNLQSQVQGTVPPTETS